MSKKYHIHVYQFGSRLFSSKTIRIKMALDYMGFSPDDTYPVRMNFAGMDVDEHIVFIIMNDEQLYYMCPSLPGSRDITVTTDSRMFTYILHKPYINYEKLISDGLSYFTIEAASMHAGETMPILNKDSDKPRRCIVTYPCQA